MSLAKRHLHLKDCGHHFKKIHNRELRMSTKFNFPLLIKKETAPTQSHKKKETKFNYKVPPGQFIEVEGINIHYEKIGTGSEPLFMLTAGMGSSRLDYHQQLEGLDSNRFTLIAWDAPGYGFSRPPEREYCLNMLNKDAHLAVKFLKKLGVEKTNVLGFCNGAVSAMILAADYPEMVKKLVLIESYSYYKDQFLLYYERMRDWKNWDQNVMQEYVDVYGEDFLMKMNGLLDHSIQIRNVKERNLCKEKLSLIQSQTLILQSKKSRGVTQEHSFNLVNEIKNSRLILLENGSHQFIEKKPKLVNRIVTDFIFENNDINVDLED